MQSTTDIFLFSFEHFQRCVRVPEDWFCGTFFAGLLFNVIQIEGGQAAILSWKLWSFSAVWHSTSPSQHCLPHYHQFLLEHCCSGTPIHLKLVQCNFGSILCTSIYLYYWIITTPGKCFNETLRNMCSRAGEIWVETWFHHLTSKGITFMTHYILLCRMKTIIIASTHRADIWM